jgi:GTPase Era involved in 16S rRNA processing
MDAPVFAVVGHPNKGKSSIVATLAADDSVRIGPEPGTTRHCREYPMTVDHRVLYTLVDTPGFQRSRRAWAWMRQHETTADRHVDVVRTFVEVHRRQSLFSDECELLEPILNGAGILYVVDGSVPYGEEYEPEMEILRWTGQPSMALINPIGSADYVESWRRALGQYFRVVRVFNAVMAEFSKRTELLRGFGQLKEEWREPLEQAVICLEQDQAAKRLRAARVVAETLVVMLSHRIETRTGAEPNLELMRPELEGRFRDELRRFESRCRDRVESVYEHRRIARRETVLDLAEADLFAERTWLAFGLSRRDLVATGALGGAATGAFVDVHLGGASLFAGAAIGAGIGASLAWWTAGRLVSIRVMNLPLGGKAAVAGPSKNPNLPYVVLNRARYHRLRIARRSHAMQEELALPADPHEVLEPLATSTRRELEAVFRKVRRGGDDPSRVGELSPVLERIFAADETAALSAPKTDGGK